MEFDELVRTNIQEVLDAVSSRSSRAASQQPAAVEAGEAGHNLSGPVASEAAPLPGLLDANLLEIPHSSDATIRLLKARIKSLEEQLGVALSLNQEEEAALTELQKQAKLAGQKELAWGKQHKALEAQVERHQQAAAAAREALAAKEQHMKELSKDSAKADKDRRAAEQESRARDVRLQRALEEVDKYKALLQDIKMQGQEVKDVAKSRASQAQAEVKRVERQKAELLAIVRKQAKLIDVLRRQRAHLEAAQLLSFTEAEFLQSLDVRAG